MNCVVVLVRWRQRVLQITSTAQTLSSVVTRGINYLYASLGEEEARSALLSPRSPQVD